MRLGSYLPSLVLVLAACQPDIGDPCSTPIDCSFGGERICLTDQPGGYCTIFNCEPNRCPDEAVCVAFRATLSEVEGCRGELGGERLQRTFCLKRCSSDGDCRSGYACVSVSADYPFSARVLDRGREGARVCAVPYSGEPLPEDRSGDVCSGISSESLPGPLSSEPPADAGPLVDAARSGDAAVDAGRSADAARDAAQDAPLMDSSVGAPDVGVSLEAGMD
jgi:hypothetical protein